MPVNETVFYQINVYGEFYHRGVIQRKMEKEQYYPVFPCG